jgi:hypothetical protein
MRGGLARLLQAGLVELVVEGRGEMGVLEVGVEVLGETQVVEMLVGMQVEMFGKVGEGVEQR